MLHNNVWSEDAAPAPTWGVDNTWFGTLEYIQLTPRVLEKECELIPRDQLKKMYAKIS